MDLKKLNPWNWFKHEEQKDTNQIVPVRREATHATQQPVNNMLQLHREIDRLFDDAFRGFGFPSLNRSDLWNQGDLAPLFQARVNIASDDKQYTVTLEAPGLEQKDLAIELRERTLVIKGNKQQEQEEKDKHYYRIERHYGSFERVLAIPDDANPDNITANMKNGVLTVNIPRQEEPDTAVKKIEIRE